MTATADRRRRIAIGVDIALPVALFAIGAAVAIWLVLETHLLFFYQTMMPSGVMAACGRGFAEPGAIPQALHDFLYLGSSSFDCGVLDGVPSTGGLNAMARAHLYLLSLVIALWSIGGVSYVALWPLAAALHGAYVAAGYALGRLFLPRWAAVVLALLLAVSPLATAVLAASIRDYAKAPFLLWSLVLLVLALRAGTARRLLMLGAGLGAVVGLGAGFRGDIVEIFPLGVFALTLGQWRGAVPIAGRLCAAAAFLVLSALLMAPLKVGVNGAAGALWMQGATEPYRWQLHLPPAPYDLGERYSDELTYSGISADLRRPDPAGFDAGEGLPGMQTQAQRLSSGYVSRWGDLFIADMATRALAALWWDSGLVALLTVPQPPVVLYDTSYPGRFRLSRWLAPALALLAGPWTPVLGVLGLLSVLWRVFARSRREAAGLGVVLVVLLASPSLQFALRHLFHLEGLFWLGILSLLTLPWAWGRMRGALPGFSAWSPACLAAIGAIYAGLVAWQDRALHREVAVILAAPTETLPLDPVSLGNGRTLLRVTSQPADAAGLFGGPPDAATLRAGIPHFDNVRAAAARMVLEIGPNCMARDVSVTLSYDKRSNAWQNFDRTLSIAVPAIGQAPTLVIVPAFYRPDQAFRGFELSDADLPCLQAIKRAEPRGRLPIIFSAVLTPGWTERPLHLRLLGQRGAPPPR